jgi:serine protease Do
MSKFTIVNRFKNKKCFFSILLMTVALASSSAIVQAQQTPPPQTIQNDIVPHTNAPASFADMVDKLLPSVVNISSTQKIVAKTDENQGMPTGNPFEGLPENSPFYNSPFQDFFEEFMERNGGGGNGGEGEMGGDPSVPPTSLGSGFIIDAEKGYVITNAHVIKDADEVQVTLHDDTILNAKIIGSDEKMDLAVLKIDPKEHALQGVSFGNSDTMRVGDWVVAIGNPFGLGGTVTAGIISARQRNINAGPYDDFIQTDASINRGNSGGPMFSMMGQVIGINTAIFSPSGGSVGIGFAIPSALAEPVIKQLIEFGHTRRGWLGVKIQSVNDEIAESLGLDKARGALIAGVTAGGPAEKSGIKVGDVILEFAGKDVAEMRFLPRIVAETEIGKKAPVVVWRDGKKVTFDVDLGELEKAEKDGLLAENDKAQDSQKPEAKTEGETVSALGLTLSSIGAAERQHYKLDETVTGIIVQDVAKDSESLKKGIRKGDIIQEANQNPITNIQDLKDQVDNAKKDKRNSILLLINRAGNIRFVAVALDDKK